MNFSCPGLLRDGLAVLTGPAGNLGWPILLRQLRSDFRKNRFFFTHFSCLALLGMVVIVMMVARAGEPDLTPSQLGQSLFNWFFVAQVLIVLVVFPAFSATAFAEERANQSLDLLLVSPLSPAEVVLGKLLASTVFCLLYIVAAMPLLSVSFLFGGVTVGEMAAGYAGLVVLTLLVSMLGLCVSSGVGSGTRATLWVYVLLLALVALGLATLDVDLDAALAARTSQSIVTVLQRALGGGGERTGMVLATLATDGAVLFACLFLLTANQLKSAAEDRSSALRLLVLAYLPLRLALFFAWGFLRRLEHGLTWATAAGGSLRETLYWLAAALLVVTLVFPAEEARLSRRIQAVYSSLRGLKAPLRILAPGPFSGFLFAVGVSLAACGLLLAVFRFTLGPFPLPDTRRLAAEALVGLPIYFAAFASLGFLLAVLAFRPLHARLTVFFTLLITLLLPAILWMGDTAGPTSALAEVYHLYYLSPAVISWSLLPAAPLEVERSTRVLGLEIVHAGKAAYGCLTLLHLGLGVWLARRLHYPLWSPRVRARGGARGGEDGDGERARS